MAESVEDISKVIRPDDHFIVVMGISGAGKSNFISLITGEDPIENEGSLISSAVGITIHTINHNGRAIHLIDAPAIDSSVREEEDVFEEWAYWLVEAYSKGLQINGLVYLHNILDPRFTHSSSFSLDTVKKMCGVENYAAITMATTRWDIIDETRGDARAKELVQNQRFWGDLCYGHCRIEKLDNSRESAMKIINDIVDRNRKYVLEIQRQMVDEKKDLHQTEAGKFLFKAWMEEKNQTDQERKRLLEELDSRTLNGTEGLDEEVIQISEDIKQMETDADQKKQAMQNLQKKTDELTTTWDINVRNDLRRAKDELSRQQEYLEELATLHTEKFAGKEYSAKAKKEFEKELKKMERKVEALQKAHSRREGTYHILVDVGPMVVGVLGAALPLIACTIM